MTQDPEHRRAVEDAWKVHAALADWTGKVDAKASFALTLEAALLGAVVTFSVPERPLGDLTGAKTLLAYRTGAVLLALAAACAVVAVIPRIRFWRTLSEWETNVVYFGHLRHWTDPAALAVAYKQLDMLTMLSKQQIAMSKIAWSKHKWVQFSLASAVVGSSLLVGAGVAGA